MTKTDSPATKGIEHRVARLLEVDDATFLREAYFVALGRGIDRDGETFYGERMKAGATRVDILQTLAGSPEGGKHLSRSPRIATALMRLGGESVPTASSVDELLALPDREFVEAAVRLLLDQGTDLETRGALLTRLRGGMPRFKVLLDLARRSRRTAFPELPGLDELISQAKDPLYPTARSVAELFALHDEAFVDSAYKTLMRRAPDFKGLAHYISRLREGFSRSSVLYELARSSEGRARGGELPGLQARLQGYRLNKLPGIGGPLARLMGAESDSPAARRERMLASLVMRNHALQAQVEGAGLQGLSQSADSGELATAMLARQEAITDIQRDSFEREINALRKLVVEMMDRPAGGRGARRSPARPATRRGH